MLIKNGKVYTMSNFGILNSGDIRIDKGKIVEIGNDLSPISNEEVIKLNGEFVYPGFIDVHGHMGLYEWGMGFEGADGNEMTDPITPHMRGIDGINPMDISFKHAREGGVTVVVSGPGSANVCGGTFGAFKTYGTCIDEMVVKNPIGMKVAFGENPKRVYNSKSKMPMTRMGTAALLRSLIVESKNYLAKKEKAESKNEVFTEFNLKYEAMIPVLKKEIPLKAHCHRADDILTAIRIAKEFDLDLTLDHCTEGHLIADKIKESGFPAIVGPTMTHASKIELGNKTFDTPSVLINKGVKVAIVTDHPVIEQEYLPICAGLATKNTGLSELDALKAITINAAEIVNIQDKVGSIEKGKDADIVIFDKSALFSDSKCLYTIINGEIVHRL